MASLFLAIGHGVQTDGTWDSGTAWNGYTEAELMKPIVGAAIPILEAHGVDVHTDYPENDMNITTCVAYANEHGIDYYVSCHCDYDQAPSGTLPIVYPGSGTSYNLASAINASVMLRMGIGTRGILQRSDDWEVRGTDMPACIFETGCISKDIDILTNSAAYGQAIAFGILDFLGISYNGGDTPAPSPQPTPTPSPSNPYGFTSIYNSDYYLEYGDGPDENITQFQRDCNFCGYWGENGPLVEDGYYGSESEYACECVQRFHGLDVDGKFGVNSDLALMTEIAQIQEALTKHGYNIAVDGGAGPATINATKDFQSKNGLEPDGICGDNTRALLGI
ncbi:peptidoglycan-binding protein [Holdemanella porci]|uniref:peptidoglycan-binding protein n=1 Tax=Holdemanella porci TaxID=2652276 RepID=UPI003AB48F4C